MTDIVMKDIVGRELAISDKVAFNPPRFKGLILGRVVGFTPKKVTVEYKQYYNSNVERTHVYPADLALVP